MRCWDRTLRGEEARSLPFLKARAREAVREPLLRTARPERGAARALPVERVREAARAGRREEEVEEAPREEGAAALRTSRFSVEPTFPAPCRASCKL